MPVSIAFIKELENVDPQLRRVLLSMLEELERQREESVTKKEFNELKEIIRDLGKSVKELAEAQRRTEERLEAFEKQTEENFNRVWKAINELAEAQKRTEEEIAKLVKRMDVFEERLEGISNSVGYVLENTSYKALPRLLAERYGLEVEGKLIRRYLPVARKEIQVNIYGHARKYGQRLLVLGECKVRPSRREIERFEKYARRIAEQEKSGEGVSINLCKFYRECP